jgi:hypothetical protein
LELDGLGDVAPGVLRTAGGHAWSQALHESDIAYSILESTHVWSLILFFGLVIVFDLRLASVCYRSIVLKKDFEGAAAQL